jgi:hypothetical protein
LGPERAGNHGDVSPEPLLQLRHAIDDGVSETELLEIAKAVLATVIET